MYDLIIIGASAAGLPAAVYASRRRLNFKVISDDFGGEMALSGDIENWPGITHITGVDLTEKFREQIKANDIEVEEGIRVEKIEKDSEGFVITGEKNGTAIEEKAKAVIVTTGVHPLELGIEGEKKFRNKGLSYCTVCDGPLFSNKIVAVIGGANSALESVIMMSEIAKKVYLLTINPELEGDNVLQEKVSKDLTNKNVEIIYNAYTQKILGDSFVSEIEFKEGKDGQIKKINVEGVFVHIGMTPNSDFLPVEVEKNEFGEIRTDKIGKTNIPGLYAAGDVTDIPYNQLVIAAGQGVTAVLSVVDYLNKLKT